MNQLPHFAKFVPTGIELSIHVKPASSQNALRGCYDGRLKIALTAPPTDGEANEELIVFLSELFSIPKKAVHLLNGTTSPKKTVLITLSEAQKIITIEKLFLLSK